GGPALRAVDDSLRVSRASSQATRDRSLYRLLRRSGAAPAIAARGRATVAASPRWHSFHATLPSVSQSCQRGELRFGYAGGCRFRPRGRAARDGGGRHFESMSDWSGRIDAWDAPGELRQILTDAVDALPPEYRVSLVLHDVEGMSNPDIAEALGIGLDAVRARVHRARL